jgi:hypothetical protein
MNEVSLVDFFKTGIFGGVNLNMSRTQVLGLLGKPDNFIRGMYGVSDLKYESADVWIYGGVELSFLSRHSTGNENLQEIYFIPSYLLPPKIYLPKTDSYRNGRWKTKLNKWLFEENKKPTKTQLIQAFSRESIAFQDTGLEMLIWKDEWNYQVVPFQEEILKSPNWMEHDNECFGTLILNSNVQVRYDEKDVILKISNGADWMYKGKNQNY